MPIFQAPQDHLCLALDVDTADEARSLIDKVHENIGIFKIGYQLGYNDGLSLARALIAEGKQVFLDFKLLDIDQTIASAIRSLSAMGAAYLTLHAYPKAMRAAVGARGDQGPILLGVSVLTSMDDKDLKEAGYAYTAKEMVLKRAKDAHKAGMGGLVCSAQEAAFIKEKISEELILVTPGIRPQKSQRQDQKRVMTPGEAIKAGSDILVIGRPITKAQDPALVCSQIIEDIEKSL